MSTDFHSPIGRAGLPAEPSDAAARKAAEAERQAHENDAWAIAIAQVLVEARPRLTLGLPEADAAAAALPASGESVMLPTLSNGEAVQAGAEAALSGAEPGAEGPPLPNRVLAQLSDNRLGRLELSVARGANGLHIVINVADAHVKALIESEQALLMKSLKNCGLRVDSVEIGSQLECGTALAPPEAAQERALARSRGLAGLRSDNVRGRASYAALPEQELEDDTERVDLTA